MSFAIVTDSLAGLPLAQIARRGLVVIPLSYTISGKEHLCLAPEGYDSAAFFQTMKLRGEVSTSMVPPHRFLTFLKPLLRSGLDLLFLSASSGLSSSYQSACMAAEQLREEFPQRQAPDCGLPLLLPGAGTTGPPGLRPAGEGDVPGGHRPHPPLPPAPDCPPFHGG